jgi:hypothetical protein
MTKRCKCTDCAGDKLVLEVLLFVCAGILVAVGLLSLFSEEAHANDTLPVGRGAVFLGAQHPTFPTDRAVERLSEAAPHAVFAVGHKIFGQDYVRINGMVDALLTHERRPSSHVTVIIYLDCGPCRPPRRPTGLFDLILPGLDIPALSRALSSGERGTLEVFANEARAIEMGMPAQPGMSLILVPILEDNAEEEAFDVAASIIAEAFANRSDWSLARNRIDNEPDSGYRREVHRLELTPSLKPGDIATADGQNICTRFDANCNGMSLQHAKNYIRSGEANGASVLLWRPEWQGLPAGIGNNPVAVPAAQRTMTIPQINCFRNVLRRN